MSTNRHPLSPTTRRAGGALASALGLAVAVGCSASGDAGASMGALPTSDASESRPTPYQLGVAREGNVVVVIESTGRADRTEVALELALQRAIPGLEGRCGATVLPCPRPVPSDAGSGPFDLTAVPTLTDADWARVTRGQYDVVGSAAGTSRLLDCVAVVPDSVATEVHARSYDVTTQPAAGLQEFVLRYDDAVLAAEAVSRIRGQFVDCPEPDGVLVSMQLHEHSASDGSTWWLVDEALVGDRTFPGREPLTPQ